MAADPAVAATDTAPGSGGGPCGAEQRHACRGTEAGGRAHPPSAAVRGNAATNVVSGGTARRRTTCIARTACRRCCLTDEPVARRTAYSTFPAAHALTVQGGTLRAAGLRLHRLALCMPSRPMPLCRAQG